MQTRPPLLLILLTLPLAAPALFSWLNPAPTSRQSSIQPEYHPGTIFTKTVSGSRERSIQRRVIPIAPNRGETSFRTVNEPGIDRETVSLFEQGIEAQRRAGHPGYNPERVYIIDPSRQQLLVINRKTGTVEISLPAGTGKRGLGFAGAQTPVGFFTMGGVRIAKNASAYIQTGDSRQGVSGIYAEILYPPSHPDPRLRGRVPNNVIIHGFNPRVSSMLRERHEKQLIGRIPCTTGCPVFAMKDLPTLAPYLKKSAGAFDPSSRPNSNLRRLIARGQVSQYSNQIRLGDPILILDRPFRG